jgi:hypothetical protein
VAFLTRTRTPPAVRDTISTGAQPPATTPDPAEYLRDLAATPTSGGPTPAPAPTSGAI